MEGSLNETLQDHQKVEYIAEDKEVVVEVADNDDSSNQTPDGDIVIKEKQATQSEENVKVNESGKVEETEDVSEPVADSFEQNKVASDAVELELKEEAREDVVSLEDSDGKEAELHLSEDNKEHSSVSENEGLRETETVKDMTVTEEEKNVIVSSFVTDEEPTDVASKETTLETSIPKSDEEPTDVASKETLETGIPKSEKSDEVPPIITGEVPKGIEEPLVPSTDGKVGEQPQGQEESTYGSANESFQPSVAVPDTESATATGQDNTELPRSTENPTTGPVTQRQHTPWKSCCGLFEILRGGDR